MKPKVAWRSRRDIDTHTCCDMLEEINLIVLPVCRAIYWTYSLV